jgi:hypothetical protein
MAGKYRLCQVRYVQEMLGPFKSRKFLLYLIRSG